MYVQNAGVYKSLRDPTPVLNSLGDTCHLQDSGAVGTRAVWQLETAVAADPVEGLTTMRAPFLCSLTGYFEFLPPCLQLWQTET